MSSNAESSIRELHERILACTLCPLCEGRHKAVPGEGPTEREDDVHRRRTGPTRGPRRPSLRRSSRKVPRRMPTIDRSPARASLHHEYRQMSSHREGWQLGQRSKTRHGRDCGLQTLLGQADRASQTRSHLHARGYSAITDLQTIRLGGGHDRAFARKAVSGWECEGRASISSRGSIVRQQPSADNHD